MDLDHYCDGLPGEYAREYEPDIIALESARPNFQDHYTMVQQGILQRIAARWFDEDKEEAGKFYTESGYAARFKEEWEKLASSGVFPNIRHTEHLMGEIGLGELVRKH